MDAKMQAAVQLAGLTDAESALLEAVWDAPAEGTALAIAEAAGIARRSFFRAVRSLQDRGLVNAVGVQGSGFRVVRSEDAEAKLKALAVAALNGEQAGAEYNALSDVEAARRDRARYCYAVGHGPKWAMELGRRMAEGELALVAEVERLRGEVERAEIRRDAAVYERDRAQTRLENQNAGLATMARERDALKVKVERMKAAP